MSTSHPSSQGGYLRFNSSVTPTIRGQKLMDLYHMKVFKDIDVRQFSQREISHPDQFESGNNPISWIFQEVTDTCSLPANKEFNPAIFSLVIFPFFFDLMFSDVSFGSLVVIF